MFDLRQGNCLEIMSSLCENSIDLIVCDLPYGVTDCEWDSIISFDALWKEYRRLLKPNGVCILFGIQPFTSKMILSNPKEFSHVWYWRKKYPSGFLNAKKQPMRMIEDVVIFVLNRPAKNNKGMHLELRKYFFDELAKSGLKRKDVDKILNSSMSSHYLTRGEQFSIPSENNYKILQEATGCFQRPFAEIQKEYRGELSGKRSKSHTYNPQGLTDCEIRKGNKSGSVYHTRLSKAYTQTKTGYPRNLLEFDGLNASAKDRFHPTQKPVDLLEYLIKTYSNEGETVLDNCMGSGSTGVAAVNTDRNFIGMELDKGYFDIAEKRINEAYEQLSVAVP